MCISHAANSDCMLNMFPFILSRSTFDLNGIGCGVERLTDVEWLIGSPFSISTLNRMQIPSSPTPLFL